MTSELFLRHYMSDDMNATEVFGEQCTSAANFCIIQPNTNAATNARLRGLVRRDICHGSSRNQPVDYILTAVKPTLGEDPGTRQATIDFYDWVMNHSYLQRAFPVKNPEDVFEKGVLITSDVDAAIFLHAAQASRITTNEYRNAFKAMADVRAAGFKIHPFTVLPVLASAAASVRGGFLTGRTLNNTISTGGHTPFPTSLYGIEMLTHLATVQEDGLRHPYGGRTFREARGWPAGANGIAAIAAVNSFQSLATNLYLKGTPLERVEVEESSSAWPSATSEFLQFNAMQTATAAPTTAANNRSMNLNLLEETFPYDK